MNKEENSTFNSHIHQITLREFQPKRKRGKLKQQTVEPKEKTPGTFTVSNAKVYKI